MFGSGNKNVSKDEAWPSKNNTLVRVFRACRALTRSVLLLRIHHPSKTMGVFEGLLTTSILCKTTPPPPSSGTRVNGHLFGFPVTPLMAYQQSIQIFGDAVSSGNAYALAPSGSVLDAGPVEPGAPTPSIPEGQRNTEAVLLTFVSLVARG